MRKAQRIVQAIFFFLFSIQVLTGCGDELSRWPTMRFERGKWMHANEDNRFVFARDLVENKKLLGLSKPSVVDLLGTPSYDDPNGDYITYVLKSDSGGVYLLDIRFGKGQKERFVDKVFVRTA